MAYRHLSEPSVLQRFVARRGGRALAGLEHVQQAAREMLTGLAYRYEDSEGLDPDGAQDLLVGARAPERLLVDGSLRPRWVHEVLEGDQVTGFLFCGRRRETLGAARGVSQTLVEQPGVGARIIVGWSPDAEEAGDDLLVDYDGALRTAYGAEPGDILVIRPDGHVGHRGSIDEPGRTGTYLARLLARSPVGATHAA